MDGAKAIANAHRREIRRMDISSVDCRPDIFPDREPTARKNSRSPARGRFDLATVRTGTSLTMWFVAAGRVYAVKHKARALGDPRKTARQGVRLGTTDQIEELVVLQPALNMWRDSRVGGAVRGRH